MLHVGNLPVSKNHDWSGLLWNARAVFKNRNRKPFPQPIVSHCTTRKWVESVVIWVVCQPESILWGRRRAWHQLRRGPGRVGRSGASRQCLSSVITSNATSHPLTWAHKGRPHQSVIWPSSFFPFSTEIQHSAGRTMQAQWNPPNRTSHQLLIQASVYSPNYVNILLT